MRTIMALLAFFIIFGAAPRTPAFAADELFDKAAVSEQLEKGVAFLKAKNYDAAIREFEQAAEQYPEAEPYYYLGYAYYMKSKTGDGDSRKKSIENFDKAYELDPNFTPAKFKPAEHPLLKKETAPSETPAPGATAPASPQTAPTATQPEMPSQPTDQPKP